MSMLHNAIKNSDSHSFASEALHLGSAWLRIDNSKPFLCQIYFYAFEIHIFGETVHTKRCNSSQATKFWTVLHGIESSSLKCGTNINGTMRSFPLFPNSINTTCTLVRVRARFLLWKILIVIHKHFICEASWTRQLTTRHHCVRLS